MFLLHVLHQIPNCKSFPHILSLQILMFCCIKNHLFIYVYSSHVVSSRTHTIRMKPSSFETQKFWNGNVKLWWMMILKMMMMITNLKNSDKINVLWAAGIYGLSSGKDWPAIRLQKKVVNIKFTKFTRISLLMVERVWANSKSLHPVAWHSCICHLWKTSLD